jgi:hypothetical protein
MITYRPITDDAIRIDRSDLPVYWFMIKLMTRVAKPTSLARSPDKIPIAYSPGGIWFVVVREDDLEVVYILFTNRICKLPAIPYPGILRIPLVGRR